MRRTFLPAAWRSSRCTSVPRNSGLYRIANGQMAEAWYAEDTLGWFQQLGLLPEDIGAFGRVWEKLRNDGSDH